MTRQRLPFPVSPQADESLPGFLLRTADNNFLRSPRILLDGAGWARLDLPPSPRVLGQLAALAECPANELLALFGAEFRSEKRHSLLRLGDDWVLRDRFVRAPRLPCCPHCLSERPTLRAVWELAPYTVCPRHRIQLIDRCSDCNQSVVFDRPGIARCPCGADLRGMPAEADDEAQRRLALAIEAKIAQQAGEEGTLQRLFALSLDTAFRLLWLCGQYATIFGSRHRDKGSVSLESLVIRQAMAALDGGPEATTHALQESIAANAADQQYGGPIASVVDCLFAEGAPQLHVQQAVRVLWHAAERSQKAAPADHQLSLGF